MPIRGRDVALALLRDLAHEFTSRTALRRLYAEVVGRASVCWDSDQVVLEGLARRLVTGELKAWTTRVPEIQVPAGAHLPAQEAKPPAVSTAKKEQPSLSNPRWSAPRIAVGAEIEAAFSYAAFDPGKSVTITVYEVNADGSRKKIGTLEAKVPAKAGNEKATWKRDPDATAADLKEDEQEGDTGPVEYRFTAEADGVAPTGLSGPLWLTNDVEIELVGDDGKTPAKDGTEVVLHAADGAELRAESSGGKVRFEGVVVGPLHFELSGHAELVDGG